MHRPSSLESQPGGKGGQGIGHPIVFPSEPQLKPHDFAAPLSSLLGRNILVLKTQKPSGPAVRTWGTDPRYMVAYLSENCC